MQIFLDSLWDALKDTLIILPFLYLTYLLVSYFSHNDNEKYSKILHKTNKAGPVIGSFLGSIPQCGFSSVMSNLYSRKIVTLGTLIAVFVATSDEALPLMISKPEFIPKLLLLMAIKIIYAIIVGYIIDGMIHLFSKKKQVLHEYHDRHCHEGKEVSCEGGEILDSLNENILNDCKGHEQDHDHEQEHNHDHAHEHKCCHPDEAEGGHNHTHSHCCATNIFLDALKHTLIILIYVFIATLLINLIKGYCGGLDPLKKIFTSNIYLQILLACLIGLIPNCASSVFLVEMFMEGVIMFPALVAGLSAGAGVGLIVLYTCNFKKIGQNIFITCLMLILAIILGIITNFLPIW